MYLYMRLWLLKKIYILKKATTLYLYITRCYSKPIIINVRKHFSFRMQEKKTLTFTQTHTVRNILVTKKKEMLQALHWNTKIKLNKIWRIKKSWNTRCLRKNQNQIMKIKCTFVHPGKRRRKLLLLLSKQRNDGKQCSVLFFFL